MKISIITVCLNSEKTIEKTILSVLAQEYEELEYIIVDGKSEDRTLEIIKRYENQISTVVSEPDAGIYDAMNKGIRYATGEVIGIINSDDWYEPDTVKTVVEMFRNSNAEVLYGQLKLIDGDREVKVYVPEDIDKLRYEMALTHPTVFIKRDIYKQYGVFDTRYKVCADYELMLRLYTKKVRFQYIEKVMANYRIDGISSRVSMDTVNDVRTIAMNYLHLAPMDKQDYYGEQIEIRYRQNYFKHILFEEEENALDILLKQRMNSNVPVAIWGSGKWGKQMFALLKRQGVDVSFFVDINKNKWNTIECGVNVNEPNILESFSGIVLIMVQNHSKDILFQIEGIHNPNIQSISWEELVNYLI